MLRLLSLAMLIIFSVCGSLVAAPKIELLERNWDFGHAPQKSSLRHNFWIKNIGSDTLKIIKVKPG